MPSPFTPEALPVLVGSLPLEDHGEAMDLVMRFTPEIPSWSQLPIHREEGMIDQFLPGLPGVVEKNGKRFIDTQSDPFNADLVAFYEAYLAVTEEGGALLESRFGLTADTAQGFFTFLEALKRRKAPPAAVKGQVTGPITFATALVDQKGTPLFYDLQLRDMAVKLLALKARWQVRRLKESGVPVILFMDEPGMAGFGSSEFTSISREDVRFCFTEMIEAIQAEDGMAGIHVCANTDWSLILSLPFDIVNFDAYAYFDRFILYAEDVKRFLESGGILAWGMVPTLNAEALRQETVETLAARWKDTLRQLDAIGIPPDRVTRQSLITPSCGIGTLPLDLMKKVLMLTRELSLKIRGAARL